VQGFENGRMQEDRGSNDSMNKRVLESGYVKVGSFVYGPSQ